MRGFAGKDGRVMDTNFSAQTATKGDTATRASVPTKERPILFSSAMVRAILDGRKSQTRRIVKPQPHESTTAFRDIPDVGKWYGAISTRNDFGEEFYPNPTHGDWVWRCPYGKPGDKLWVRESFQPILAEELGADPDGEDYDYKTGRGYQVTYPATDGIEEFYDLKRDRISSRITPSIHMPRWASRITLDITNVRVQRLQEISRDDAKAEGVEELAKFPCITPWRNYLLKPGAPFAMNFSTPERSFISLWDSINGEGSSDANPWVWAITFQRIPAALGDHQ